MPRSLTGLAMSLLLPSGQPDDLQMLHRLCNWDMSSVLRMSAARFEGERALQMAAVRQGTQELQTLRARQMIRTQRQVVPLEVVLGLP